jgi:type IV pilus assembly protein PilN
MYSLDVNFLKERQIPDTKPSAEKQKINLGDVTPIWVGAGVGVGIPALLYVGYLSLQNQTTEVTTKITQRQAQITNLDQKIATVTKIKQDKDQASDEVKALVTVFDQIRPWSAVLQDLRDRIPQSVQIDDIKQIAATPPPPPASGGKGSVEPVNLAGGMEITGYAQSFDNVNDFLLILQQSKFLNSEEGRITTAELVPAPNSNSKGNSQLHQVVKYTIKVGLSNVPASTFIKELEEKGSQGLVARLLDIKKAGVITK